MGIRHILLLLATLVLNDVHLIQGFVTPRYTGDRRICCNKQILFQNSSTLYSAGNDEGATSSASAPGIDSKEVTASLVNSDRLPFSSLSGVPLTASIVGLVMFAVLVLPQSKAIGTAIITTYSTLLAEHPLPTKSLTSGTLCGVSDIIAQFREGNRKQFNFKRWIRFAGKGCVGGLIWVFWYDKLDYFLDQTNEYNFFKVFGIVTDELTQPYLGFIKTMLSILIEQFLWCPIVFGFFEIPVSTILNGGGFSSVKKEVDSKLGSLLLSNAKIWTFANLIIYGIVPVDYRPIISNFVDVLWQSIVSSVSADCGRVSDDVCVVDDSDGLTSVINSTQHAGVDDDDNDLAFYAERSRF